MPGQAAVADTLYSLLACACSGGGDCCPLTSWASRPIREPTATTSSTRPKTTKGVSVYFCWACLDSFGRRIDTKAPSSAASSFDRCPDLRVFAVRLFVLSRRPPRSRPSQRPSLVHRSLRQTITPPSLSSARPLRAVSSISTTHFPLRGLITLRVVIMM